MSSETTDTTHSRDRWWGFIAVLIGAAAIWGSGRMTWMTVTAQDDKQGTLTRSLVGSVWAPELTALALALAAAMVAMTIVRRTARRIVAALALVCSAIPLWTVANTLVTPPDPSRARNILLSGQASSKASNPETITQWAQIESIDVNHFPIIVLAIGALIGVIGAAIVIARPGVDRTRTSRYDRSSKQASIAHDLEADPQSGRLLWDALDSGMDPTTDRSPGSPGSPSRSTDR